MLTQDDFKLKYSLVINKGLALGYLKKLDRTIFDMDVYLKTKGVDLQRPLVWTDHQKSELIISIFKGIKIPVISIIQQTLDIGDDEKVIYHVIDGKQRLSALFDFIEGKFPILYHGEKYYIDELDDSLQRIVLLYTPIFDVTYIDDFDGLSESQFDDYLISLFELLNFSGTQQAESHKNMLLALKSE